MRTLCGRDSIHKLHTRWNRLEPRLVVENNVRLSNRIHYDTAVHAHPKMRGRDSYFPLPQWLRTFEHDGFDARASPAGLRSLRAFQICHGSSQLRC